MADLTLKGTLNLMGTLTFKPSPGGKLKIGNAGLEALVEVMPGDPPQCTAAPPVILPPAAGVALAAAADRVDRPVVSTRP
jgi:hypothetical protein